MPATRERPVQHSSEVFGFGAEGQGFVVVRGVTRGCKGGTIRRAPNHYWGRRITAWGQARSHGGHSGAVPPKFLLCPPNFLVPRKICFKYIIKTKIVPP